MAFKMVQASLFRLWRKVKNEHHGYLCGDSIEKIATILDQQKVAMSKSYKKRLFVVNGIDELKFFDGSTVRINPGQLENMTNIDETKGRTKELEELLEYCSPYITARMRRPDGYTDPAEQHYADGWNKLYKILEKRLLRLKEEINETNS